MTMAHATAEWIRATRLRGAFAFLVLGGATALVITLWITSHPAPGDVSRDPDHLAVTVPPIPDAQAELLSGEWTQPRKSPGGAGFWGPDIEAPFDTLWRIHTGLEFFSAPAMLGETLYFGGNDGRFRAVNSASGAEIWGYPTACGLSGEAAVDSLRVYFGGQDGYLYALDRHTGELDWSAGLGFSLFCGVGLLGDSLVVTGNSEGSLAALDIQDGTVVWHDAPGGTILGPAILDTLAVFTSEGGLVAAYTASGERAWARDFAGASSAPSISDGSVFAGFSDGTVRRLSIADGSASWETDVSPGPGRCSISRPVVLGDRVLAGTCDNRLVCLDARTGALMWDALFENWMQVPPAVGDSTVYASCDDQRLHVLDLADGSEILAMELGGYAGSAPLVVNGVIYLGTASGDFFAFRGTPRESAPGQGAPQ
jgi:outer membrane protein assembly factor BamB